MEPFTESLSNLLLSKEWLVKIDNAKSTPYLFKFCVSDETSTCCILITDTKTVWAEVLTKKQALRRWRECNPNVPTASGEEPSSRLTDLLSLVHTTGGISDASFDVVDSHDADFAVELDCGEFTWRWDGYLLGPKTSADVISRHLVMPLISVAHIAFYSADPVSEIDECDLEKTVDKIGRTARRSLDIHVKHTLAKPRIASTLQRISSLFSLAPTLPSITSESVSPNLGNELAALRAQARHPTAPPDSPYSVLQREASQKLGHADKETFVSTSAERISERAAPARQNADSQTESDDEDANASLMRTENEPKKSSVQLADPTSAPHSKTSSGPSTRNHGQSPEPKSSGLGVGSQGDKSGSESPPPFKKFRAKASKPVRDSSSDSENGGARGKSQASQESSRGGRSGSAAARGVRQPIKRGAKRF